MKIKDLVVLLSFAALLMWTVHLSNRISSVSVFNELAHDHIETAIEQRWNKPTIETIVYRGPHTVYNNGYFHLAGGKDWALKEGDFFVLVWIPNTEIWVELSRFVNN